MVKRIISLLTSVITGIVFIMVIFPMMAIYMYGYRHKLKSKK